MKINLKVRAKNPYFWTGMLGVVMTATGIEPYTLTSWDALCEQVKALLSNPFMLGSTIAAVIGVLCDPTTAGINDSCQAMLYESPRKDK
ncbi:MAG: phage holin [Clostridia bacterium]|nr:phage holin [Clostridia bacterium]MBR5265440.1 phage holin [Clostridia bacterium]